MTKEELKAHCERQIKSCETWAKHNGEEPHGKVYEEHKLILELLEQETVSRESYDHEYFLRKELELKIAKLKQQESCDDWYDIPSDEMTLEQARQAVKDLRKKLMEHLEQQPTTKNNLGVDAISRSDVLKLMQDNWHTHDGDWAMQESMDDIRALPSITPIRPKGHWYVDERPESDREVICSKCEQPVFKYHKLDFDYRPNFCPNCGADMREVEE